MSTYPFDIYEVPDELANDYPEAKDEFILIGPKKYVFTKPIREILPTIYNFDVRPDDIWIFGYPRSGTTIAQEITWLIANNFDYERASQVILDVRYPVIENSKFFAKEFEEIKSNVLNNIEDEDVKQTTQQLVSPLLQELQTTKERRFIKTHIPFSLGPKNLLQSGCKVLYLARNPKDVIVSYYNISKDFRIHGVDKMTFAQFWKHVKNRLHYAGPWFETVKEGWALRKHPNVLFLFYEDYTKNLRETILRIAKFLNKSITEEQIERLQEHLQIDNFRKNKSVNNDHLRKLGLMVDKDDVFIRKGKVGGWKEYFTGELEKEVDEWIQQNLEGSDLKIPQIGLN